MNEKTIDYLQYSMFASLERFISTSETITPVRNYTAGFLQPNGVKVYFGNALTKKALFVATGSVLHNMRVNGVSNEDYIEKILTQGAKISRLDMQITQFVTDDLITPSDYADFVRKGHVVSSHSKYGAKYIASVDEQYQDNIETVYIGDMSSRGKKGIIRAYDKGYEMDLGRYMISRLEVEDKREKAHTSAKRIVSGASIAEVIKTRFDVNDARWQDLIDAKSIDTSRGEQISIENESSKMQKRWQWLIDKVAPVIAKSIDYDMSNGYGQDRLDMFNGAIKREYDRLHN